MQSRLFIVLVLIFSLQACKYNAAKVLAKPEVNYILEAESGACLGTCPIYSLRINENLEMQFTGDRFCAFQGDTVLKISGSDYVALKQELLAQGFFDMDTVYDNPDLMDAPNYSIKVLDPQEKFDTHKVRARVGAPESFRSLKSHLTSLLVKYGLLRA